MSHYDKRIQFRAQRQPFFNDSVQLWLYETTTINGHVDASVGVSVELKKLEEKDQCRAQAPLISLTPAEAQALVDELWQAGIRPTEGSGSAGQLAAVNRHLEDMRTIVFKPKS